MKAPGSPSSPLQSTYFTAPRERRHSSHLSAVRKPAPPRPRSPEALTSAMTSSLDIVRRTFFRAS